jgi:hypothetical protein
MRRTARAILVLTAGLAIAAIAGGSAPAAAKMNLDRFTGSCSLQGDVAFSPPVTNEQQSLTVSYDATGTCSGRLNGREVSDAHVRLQHRGQSEGSCLEAHTVAPGGGRITFADGTVILYTFEFTATGTEVDFRLSGRRSGTARGHGSFLTTRTPADAAAKCAGSGNAELPMDLSLSTESTLISTAGMR